MEKPQDQMGSIRAGLDLCAVAPYTPKHLKPTAAITGRNAALAAWLAKQMGLPFIEEEAAGNDTNGRIFRFLNGPLPAEEAESLGLYCDDQIYGAIVHPLFAQKSIFHPSHGESVPENFPHQFAARLSNSAWVAPGLTTFSKKGAISAYQTLSEMGLVLRAKLANASGGKGQMRLTDEEALHAFIERVDERQINQWGLVLEANVIPQDDRDDEPAAYSSGIFTVAGQKFIYLGEQKKSMIGGYAGTMIHVVRLQDADVLGSYASDIPDVILMRTKALCLTMAALPDLVASTRFNLNFLHGLLEQKGSRIGVPTTPLSEQTLRPGGCTGAEFMASEILNSDQNVVVVSASTKVLYEGEEDNLPSKARLIWAGEDSLYKARQIYVETHNIVRERSGNAANMV